MKGSSIVVVAAIAVISLLLAVQSWADGIEGDFGPFYGVEISQLCVESASAGEDLEVKLTIENWSSETITLTGVQSQDSIDGEFYFRGALNTLTKTDSFTILRNETLNLSSSHIGIRLLGLKRDLKVGDHIPLSLAFRNGTAEVGTHAVKRGRC